MHKNKPKQLTRGLKLIPKITRLIGYKIKNLKDWEVKELKVVICIRSIGESGKGPQVKDQFGYFSHGLEQT